MSHAPTVTFDRAATRGRRLGRLLTQSELATRAGCCRKTLVEAEAGRPVGLLSAKAIARALGVGLRSLMQAGAAPEAAAGAPNNDLGNNSLGEFIGDTVTAVRGSRRQLADVENEV